MTSATIKLPDGMKIRIFVEGNYIKTSLSLPMVGHDYGSKSNAKRAFQRWVLRTARQAQSIEISR